MKDQQIKLKVLLTNALMTLFKEFTKRNLSWKYKSNTFKGHKYI